MQQELRTPYKDEFGVITLTIYTAPYDCTGQCLYCFTEEGMPRSAFLHADTSRASKSDWDPKSQLEKLFKIYNIRKGIGNKYGINILGGSFTNYSKGYLQNYVKAIYDFFNAKPSATLEDAKGFHRDADDHICILSIATRPNLVDSEWCDFMLKLGVSEVQIGVQSIRDNILEINRRGHKTEDVIKATNLLKNKGFVVVYHMMLGMVGSDISYEVEDLSFRLWKPGFCPDYLKIYPCIAVDEANHNVNPTEWFKYGWSPLSDDAFIDSLRAIKKNIPRYAYITRIQRIIDAPLVKHGPRTIVDRNLFSGVCNCIYHRSLPVRGMTSSLTQNDVNYIIHRQDRGATIEAALGEICLGYSRIEFIDNVCVLREIRVMGKMLTVGGARKDFVTAQHQGLGKGMLRSAIQYAKNRGVSYFATPNRPGVIQYLEDLGFFNKYIDHRNGFKEMMPEFCLHQQFYWFKAI